MTPLSAWVSPPCVYVHVLDHCSFALRNLNFTMPCQVLHTACFKNCLANLEPLPQRDSTARNQAQWFPIPGKQQKQPNFFKYFRYSFFFLLFSELEREVSFCRDAKVLKLCRVLPWQTEVPVLTKSVKATATLVPSAEVNCRINLPGSTVASSVEVAVMSAGANATCRYLQLSSCGAKHPSPTSRQFGVATLAIADELTARVIFGGFLFGCHVYPRSLPAAWNWQALLIASWALARGLCTRVAVVASSFHRRTVFFFF